MHLTILLDSSDHAEYTRNSQLTEDESKRHKIRNVCVVGYKLRTGKEWRS